MFWCEIVRECYNFFEKFMDIVFIVNRKKYILVVDIIICMYLLCISRLFFFKFYDKL